MRPSGKGAHCQQVDVEFTVGLPELRIEGKRFFRAARFCFRSLAECPNGITSEVAIHGWHLLISRPAGRVSLSRREPRRGDDFFGAESERRGLRENHTYR